MSKNSKLFNISCRLFPGGVNSPVRSFSSVGRHPIFIKSGQGCNIYDEEGKKYIDFCLSWGPHILGHNHKSVVNALRLQLNKGTSFGACTKNEVVFAQLIKKAFSSIDKMRLVSSGTEAVMTAVRLARGYTGKDLIVKFDGCYHGHSDSLLVRPGSGLATLGVSSSKGIPAQLAKKTISIPYNNIDLFKKTCKRFSKKIACVIIEPIAGNMGVVLPDKKFLKTLRSLTEKHNIVLIFDEVITGFRFCFGGAQDIFGIRPDLTILGKIIGAGLPIGLVGGGKKIMDFLSPEGKVYQAGTLSGNPLSTAAGIAVLTYLDKHRSLYRVLDKNAQWFVRGLKEVFGKKNIPITINRFGSMFSIFFSKDAVIDYKGALKQDTKIFKKFYNFMLKNGVYFSPSGFEANFLSIAHKRKDLKMVLANLDNFCGD